MKASGNSAPELCALNLLRTVRGEVPFDRLRGLDARNIDRPVGLATPDIEADAIWLISTYEPRVNPDEVALQALEALQGDLRMTTDVSEK
jgi:hypothetical protein